MPHASGNHAYTASVTMMIETRFNHNPALAMQGAHIKAPLILLVELLLCYDSFMELKQLNVALPYQLL